MDSLKNLFIRWIKFCRSKWIWAQNNSIHLCCAAKLIFFSIILPRYLVNSRFLAESLMMDNEAVIVYLEPCIQEIEIDYVFSFFMRSNVVDFRLKLIWGVSCQFCIEGWVNQKLVAVIHSNIDALEKSCLVSNYLL